MPIRRWLPLTFPLRSSTKTWTCSSKGRTTSDLTTHSRFREKRQRVHGTPPISPSLHIREPPPPPDDAKKKYRELCALRVGAKRQKRCPLDTKIGYSAEEWSKMGLHPPRRLAAWCTSVYSLPCDPVDVLSQMSSIHLLPLWQDTVGRQLGVLERHFAQCTQTSKDQWASERQAPEPMCVDTFDLPPVPELSDIPPSPEVGRAQDSSAVYDDAQALFPWSHLGETRVEMSTPVPRSDSRVESFSSAYASIVQAAAGSLPSPDLSRDSLSDVRMPRESGSWRSPRRPPTPLLSPQRSLAPGLESDASIQEGFDGTCYASCSIAGRLGPSRAPLPPSRDPGLFPLHAAPRTVDADAAAHL